MFLGGLQKNSLIDYPGKVSCVCFLQGCNFDCPYCHNPGLVRGWPSNQPPLNEEAFYAFLEGRKGFLDAVVISGGEPTLQKGLPSFCRNVKEMGYHVKLDTNGSRPNAINGLMEEGLIDYIAMDIKTDPPQYPSFLRSSCNPDEILLSIRLIMESGLDYEFRTTCVRPIVNASAIENIARIIQGANLFALQNFHPAEVLDPAYFRGIDPACGPEEMAFFRSIAESYVKTCLVR